jgi:hypothetical protein
MVPNADILSKQVGLSVKNFFQYYEDSVNTAFWYMPAVDIEAGILNRVQFGAGYAGGPSINFKALIFNDGDKWKHMPAMQSA